MEISQLTHLDLTEVFSSYKKCPRCNIVKPIVEGFYASRSECRNCRGVDLKQRRDKKKEENESI